MDYTSLKNLVNIDSPSGFTHEACAYIFDLLKSYGWTPEYTNKGAVRCALGENPKLSIAAHVDTLGAVVSEIKLDGTLRISNVGGLILSGYESLYVRVRTLDDQVIHGTLLLDNPSIHVNKDTRTMVRTMENMHVRLDELVTTKEETEKLGIRIGDFICFEPRYTEFENGFIKSLFMDNKAGCQVLLEMARVIGKANENYPVELFFSVYEEVGHGGSAGYSKNIEELLVIDMGIVGENHPGRETACSICAKDKTGPYDYHFKKQLVELAEKNKIPYELDTYPYYGSDGSVALRAGHNFKVALIGPGVAASHGAERTHKKGIEATFDLCMAYLKERF